jgi:exopolysaccharide production protein ExoQ
MTSMPTEQVLPPISRNRSVDGPVPMFARAETYALLLALFIFATGGAYLTPGMQEHAELTTTLVSPKTDTGSVHLVQWIIAFGISLTCTFSRWRSIVSMSVHMKLFSAAALLATLSFLWSIDPMVSLRSGIYLLFNTLFVFYLIQRFSSQELMRLFIALGVIVAVLSALTAIVLPNYSWTKVGSRMALQGVFVAKNTLGNVAVLLLTPALFLRPVRTSARIVYISVILSLIVLSLSAQAWIATFLCSCFWAMSRLLRRLRMKDAIWIAFMTLLPLVVILLVVLTYWQDILELLGKDPTLSQRTIIWAAVLQSVLKRPLLGWGYNAFWQGFTGESGAVLLVVHFPIAQSQSGLLEVLVAVGGIGLVIVLGTFVEAFRDTARCLRRGATDACQWYFLIILLTIFYSIGEANLLVQNSFPWFLYMIACVGLSTQAKRNLPARPARLKSM